MHHCLGALDVDQLDRKHFIHHAQQGIERRLDGLAPLNRNVPVEILQQHQRQPQQERQTVP